jgi:hypothetical protein
MSNPSQDYNKFLEDSSDDYPKYNKNLSECSDDSPPCSESIIIKQTDDEANYSEAYGQSSTKRIKDTEELKISIHNVLELAREQTKTYFKDCIEADKEIAEQSIRVVENFLVNYCNTNIGLALSEKRVDNAS